MKYWTAWVPAFIAGLVGVWVGLQAGRPAYAQQVIVENKVVVPRDGLRFVSETGVPVATMLATAGGAHLTLNDAQGNPAIAFEARSGGQALLTTGPDGAALRLVHPGTSGAVALDASPSGSAATVFNPGGSIAFQARGGNESSALLVSDRRGSPLLGVGASPSGDAVLQTFGQGRAIQMKVAAGADGAELSLFNEAGVAGTVLSAKPSIRLEKEAKVIWQAPPATVSGSGMPRRR